MFINTSKGGLGNIVDLVNLTNGTAFTESDVSLGPASTYTDPEGVNTRNTQIDVQAAGASPYTGSVTVRYNRVDLSTQTAATGLEYTLTGSETLADMLTVIAAQLGVVEEGLELDVPEVPTVAAGETVTINIVASTNSVLYVGQTPVTVNPSMEMESQVTTSNLDGFGEEATVT